MAFPQTTDPTETVVSTALTHIIDLRAVVNEGDLLILLHTKGRDGITVSVEPSGWTQMWINLSATQLHRASAWYKIADDTEGNTTLDVELSSGDAGTAQVYRVTGWFGTGGIEWATPSSQASITNPDSPALMPSWGAEDTLWINTLQYGDDDDAVTAGASNYSTPVATYCGAGANFCDTTASQRRELNAASDDPGTWTIAANERYTAGLIASVRRQAATKPPPNSPRHLRLLRARRQHPAAWSRTRQRRSMPSLRRARPRLTILTSSQRRSPGR